MHFGFLLQSATYSFLGMEGGLIHIQGFLQFSENVGMFYPKNKSVPSIDPHWTLANLDATSAYLFNICKSTCFLELVLPPLSKHRTSGTAAYMYISLCLDLNFNSRLKAECPCALYNSSAKSNSEEWAWFVCLSAYCSIPISQLAWAIATHQRHTPWQESVSIWQFCLWETEKKKNPHKIINQTCHNYTCT